MRQLLFVRRIYEDHTDNGSRVAQGELPGEDSAQGMAHENERRHFPTHGQESSEFVRNGRGAADSRSIIAPAIARSIVGAYAREIGYTRLDQQPVP